ncbi:MAG: LemA family protein [Bacilli bacterium]|nr:LemA family protein [Bacilli bacterium]
MSIWFLIGIVLLIIIVIGWYISNLNNLRRSNIKIDEALSGIDVALTKRYDVLTKMIEVVKGYAKYEQETLFKIIQVRENMNIKELKEAKESMDDGFDKINALVENYPDLKADESFKILQKTIVDVEEHLQAARRLYNSNVSLYNQLVESFPTNVIANANGMKKRDFFEAEDKARENVKVDVSK